MLPSLPDYERLVYTLQAAHPSIVSSQKVGAGVSRIGNPTYVTPDY